MASSVLISKEEIVIKAKDIVAIHKNATKFIL